MKIILQNVEDWDRVVEEIRPRLVPETIITLSGPLGAGKTTFVQALATTLGAKTRAQSPTFALMRIYSLKKPLSRLIHVDAYRIEDEKDLLPLNLDGELTEPQTILAIEWPKQISNWIARQSNVIQITIKPSRDERTRDVTISSPPHPAVLHEKRGGHPSTAGS